MRASTVWGAAARLEVARATTARWEARCRSCSCWRRCSTLLLLLLVVVVVLVGVVLVLLLVDGAFALLVGALLLLLLLLLLLVAFGGAVAAAATEAPPPEAEPARAGSPATSAASLCLRSRMRSTSSPAAALVGAEAAGWGADEGSALAARAMRWRKRTRWMDAAPRLVPLVLLLLLLLLGSSALPEERIICSCDDGYMCVHV